MHFVAVMIPDGIREMSPAENGASSPRVEDGTSTPADTCTADCREEVVQMSEDESRHNEMTEAGRQETTEEDGCTVQQRCFNGSEISPSSEAGDDSAVDLDRDSCKKDDDLASSDPVTDAEMKASFQDADDEKASEDDRQPTDAVAEKNETDVSHRNEANTFRHDTASQVTSAETIETNMRVTAEEDEPCFGHGMFRQFLYSDTDNHDEKVVAQNQPTERDELNGNEQPIGQTAKDTDEACDGKMSEEESETSRAGDNENALEENGDGEVKMNEYMVDETSKEKSDSESRYTREVVENDKECVRNEETEQLSENMREQTSDLLQSLDESAAETGTHAESHPERNVQTPETPAEGNETRQKVTCCTTNEKSSLAFYHQYVNVEQQLLVDNRTVEQNATEEIAANFTNASSERDTSQEPAATNAESTEEQVLQPVETSIEKEERLMVDSVHPADSQSNGASGSVEVNLHQIGCTQSVQCQSTNDNECINEPSQKSSGEDVETEYDATAMRNTEENAEFSEMEDKALTVTENSDGIQSVITEEAENRQDQSDLTNKEDNAVERSTAPDANTKEVHVGGDSATGNLGEEPNNRFDEGVEETSANRSLYAVEIRSSSIANTVEQGDDNAIFDEVDRNLQRSIGLPHATSDTTHCKPYGVPYVSAEKESHNTQEAQEELAHDNKDMQGRADETYETSEIEIMTHQDNAVELWAENRATEIVGEESAVTDEETAKTDETVERAESRNSADITEQQSKQQTKQTEPAAEYESQFIVTGNSEQVNEVVTTTNEHLVTGIYEEEVYVGINRSRESSLSSKIQEESENESKSKNAVDDSSAVNSDMRETIESTVENRTNEAEDAQQQEMIVESEGQQSTCVIETTTQRSEREVLVEAKSRSDKETTENHEEDDNKESCVEKHYEIDSSRTAGVEGQPFDVSGTAEDHASSLAVEPCDENTIEYNRECAVERETVAAGENNVTESAKQVNDSCVSDVQSTEISKTTDNMRPSEAGFDQRDRDVNELPVADSVEATEKQSELTKDDEQVDQTNSALNNVAFDVAEEDEHAKTVQNQSNGVDEVNETYTSIIETKSADQRIGEQNEITDANPVPSQTKTSPPAEVADSCNETAETIMFVYEVRKTDEISQQDSGTLESEMSNHPAEDDPELTQLINEHDDPVNWLDPVEKHGSIRTYIDGHRDIELSGVKLAADQVGVETDLLLHSIIYSNLTKNITLI